MPMGPRTEEQVFADLQSLCTLPGYIYALAFLCFRDNMVGFGESLTVDDVQEMFSSERLIRTELSTLLGLLVTAPLVCSSPTQEELQKMVSRSDELLAEIHSSMSFPLWEGLREAMTSGQAPNIDVMSSGCALRETIFYGAESAYSFQYREIAPRKYDADAAWLLQEKGFTIETAGVIADFLSGLVSAKLTALVRPKVGEEMEPWHCLSGFTFKISEITDALQLDAAQVQKVIDAFCHPVNSTNTAFTSLSAFNATNATPILQLADDIYALFQPYSLGEALYESPFYWMSGDRTYRDKAMENRGNFTEAYSYGKLVEIFGAQNVFQNMRIVGAAGDTAGEIDVLVLWGGRAVVLQAKSKKLTLEARKGNDRQLQSDFKMSVQDSYDQGYSCAQLLLDPSYRVFDGSARELKFDRSDIKLTYLFCVVSDHYPALSFQSRQFLQLQKSERICAPFVMDIFTLDVMAEMLETPLRFLSYTDKRATYSEQLHAGHELTILAYHLRQNLWVDSQYGMVMLGDDISSSLDIAMLVRRAGARGDRTPKGILTEFEGTAVDGIIKSIERSENRQIVDLGFMLLTLSGDSLRAIDEGIHAITQRSLQDGKAHDFSLAIKGGITGITLHCSSDHPEIAIRKLGAHCEMRKYLQKAPSWFGLCLSAKGDIRLGINFDEPWKYDGQLEKRISTLKPPSKVHFVAGRMIQKPIGRNDACPCESGKKFKKCCLSRYRTTPL